LGFWDTNHNAGFYAPVSIFPNAPKDLIFHFEALCVLSALSHIHQTSRPSQRIVIHTDSSNTFDIFNSMRCQAAYNHILKSAVDIIMAGSHDLRVLHISGTLNGVADSLSRFEFTRANRIAPGITIRPFQPPQVALGPSKK
ncbi:hypothetical protein HYPSUDRAFT_113779, partial [Hypholoma sublateritium FD-334 SS-4]